MKNTGKFTSFLNFIFFTDATRLMQSLQERQAVEDDLCKIDYINNILKKPDLYPSFEKIREDFIRSPFLSVLKFEKWSFMQMLFLHAIEIVFSLLSIYLAMQILGTFDGSSVIKLKLISFFFDNPSSIQKLIFASILAIVIFALNAFAATLRAQKLEKEMILEWRIPIKISQAIQKFILNLSMKERDKYKSGDIINLVQNDARFLSHFFAHGFIDFIVIVFASILITAYLIAYVGSAAWYGVGVIIVQIPIIFLLAWLGARFHQVRMKYSDARIHRISELIQGMRLFRYLNWGRFVSQEIRSITNKEFWQETKLTTQFCISFAIMVNLWMLMSVAIFAGYLIYSNGIRDVALLFGIMWLTKLFVNQIIPLPWFFHVFSLSTVAASRLKSFFLLRTQSEEFQNLHKTDHFSEEIDTTVENILSTNTAHLYAISFEFADVSFQYFPGSAFILKDVSYVFPANKTIAITGSVGSGKSTILKILLGDYTPTKGTVFLNITNQTTDLKLNLHTELGLKFMRSIQSYVPQESFMLTSTVSENVQFSYQDSQSLLAENDNLIMNSIYLASLSQDLEKFPDHLETEIGERGVNLSGGQKQRLSLARKFYYDSQIVFMDDPFSAIDTNTEEQIAKEIFSDEHKSLKTIIWTTHRLEYLSKSDCILILNEGRIYEQ